MNWWIYDRGDILTLMINDSAIAIFMSRADAHSFSQKFNIKIEKVQK